jgi:hypothetical protein
MKIIPSLSFAALAGLLSGCFPAQFTLNPGVSGRVIDARTKEPLPGAAVTLRTSTYTNKKRQVAMVSGERGEFLIPPDQEWSVYIVPMDPMMLKGAVAVEAQGHKGVTREFRTTSMGPGVTKLGDIPLEQAE